MANRILLAATVGWPSAARYAAGFAAAGCTVDALSPADAIVRKSRYVCGHHTYNPLFPGRSLRAAIAKSDPDLIVPCDDRAVSHLLALQEDASSALIERSLGAPANYPLLLSRHGSLAALRAEGVRVPDSFAIDSAAALDAALDQTGFPAVLKSDGSWGGDGVVIVRTREEAHAARRKLADAPPRWRSLARALRRRDGHFLHDALKPPRRAVSLQKFIAGRPAAAAFAARDGAVVGAIAYDVLSAEGDIGPPNVIRRVDCAEIHAAARTVARRFGLSGLHGLDFIRDASGAVHLIEINPRATQGGTLAFGPGCDLPAALAVAFSLGHRGIRSAIAGDLVAFFPRAWQRGSQSYLPAAHHDIPWDDPAVLAAIAGLPAVQTSDAALRTAVRARFGVAA